jgi:hypothetical protein
MSEPTVSRLPLTGRFGACESCGGYAYAIEDKDPYGTRLQRISTCCDDAAEGIRVTLARLADLIRGLQ